MSANGWVDAHLAELADSLSAVQEQSATVEEWGRRVAERLRAGGRLLAAGNGGSAAEAQHLTAELVGRFVAERRPYSAIALCAETSSLTAIVNDYGADEMFARQVEAHGRTDDVLVLLSTSGRSPNVLRAAERGRELGLQVLALTGAGPNPLVDASDAAVCVPAGSTAAVQAVHLVLVHALCAAVDAHLERLEQPDRGEAAVTDDRPHVVVVGDIVLDRDIDGRIERLCPDAPAPVLDVTATRDSPGGAGLAALLCAAGGARVTLVTPVARDLDGRGLVEALRPEVDVVALGHDGPTRRKVRARSDGHSLVRVDDGGPGTPTTLSEDRVRAALATADAVLVSDYGAGVTTDERLRALLTEVAARCPVVWDPHPRGGAPVAGATLVTPNLAEARQAAPDGASADAASPDALAQTLRAAWAARAVAVTAGDRGAFLATTGDEPLFVPATPARGGDTCGAGDRFAASAAVALARGGLVSAAVGAAVADASAWVVAGGAEAFRSRRGMPQVTGRQPVGGAPDEEVAALATRLRLGGRTLVATGGCFDIVHAGHVATLQAARRLGDALVVVMNSDDSVRRLKGEGRPVVGSADRARVLEALDCVDAVVVFDEDDPREILAALQPDVWAKGGDYGGRPLPETDVVRAGGGRVVLLPYLDGRSTSSLIERTGRARARQPEEVA
ncbi:PfkB family carbohydrate kinase [Cellulomonas fengjieae]|uniref:PfkB family carbohydrate kinase n=1 Tax=Cellulomonas fengjieae TaxID=2819978 RepID=UPI001AAE4E69|nr:PfkB family carbohydrate kinase [Cellulomonas fengjieae]MBO3102882.1 SIS domain-containing protein [Cellulomonas fengjieae]